LVRLGQGIVSWPTDYEANALTTEPRVGKYVDRIVRNMLFN